MKELREITDEKLKEILVKHAVWLKKKNRKLNDPSRADLSGANLNKANLSETNLSETNLCGADLSGADLSHADLCEADLSGADLSGADLSGADLCGADLCGTDLSGADLSEADLSGTDLSVADLCGAYIIQATLDEADLRDSNLQEAGLMESDVTKALLQRANLKRADLNSSDFSGANLAEANLNKANLSNVSFVEANLFGANLSDVNLLNADFDGADLTEVNLIRSDIYGANFSKAKLDRSKLIDNKCSKIGDWTDANIDGIIIDGFIKSKIPEDLFEKYKDTITVVQNDEEGFTTLFQFPEHFRTACEQYLSYFGDFLKDLGDLANTSLRREGMNTFFSVIPEDKEVALEKITEALSFFLGLTVVPEDDIFANEEKDQRQKIALNRYKQEYHSLKSKLASKEVENTALQLATGALSKNAEMSEEALSAIMLLCFKYIESKGNKVDAMTFLKKAITITKVKLPGVTINADYITKNIKHLTWNKKKK